VIWHLTYLGSILVTKVENASQIVMKMDIALTEFAYAMKVSLVMLVNTNFACPIWMIRLALARFLPKKLIYSSFNKNI
jgi:hypothetical protein